MSHTHLHPSSTSDSWILEYIISQCYFCKPACCLLQCMIVMILNCKPNLATPSLHRAHITTQWRIIQTTLFGWACYVYVSSDDGFVMIYGISECGFWILALIPEGSAKSHACSSQKSSNSVNRLGLEATVVCRTTSTEVSLGDPKFRKTVTCRIHLLTQVEYALYFELEIQQISLNERAI